MYNTVRTKRGTTLLYYNLLFHRTITYFKNKTNYPRNYKITIKNDR